MTEAGAGIVMISEHRPNWKKAPFSNSFFNFNVRSLLPSVDLDSFNDAHFGPPLKDVEWRHKLSLKNLTKYLTHHVVSPSNGLQTSLQPATASVSSSRSRVIVDELMRSGTVDHGENVAVDIPSASTSGRVDGVFWKQKGKGNKSVMFQHLGNLYNVHDQDFVRNYWDLPPGKTLEDNVPLDPNHTVSTTLKQGKQGDDRSVWLASSHKLGVNHTLATEYGNDLKGGDNFNVSTTHNVNGMATVSSNVQANSLGLGSVQVEVQREKTHGNHEIMESVMTNLRTGERLLKLTSKSVVKEVVFLNSLLSDLRGEHALKFMATIPFWTSGIFTSSLSTNLHGSKEICLSAVKKIHEQLMVAVSVTTDLKEGDLVSVEATQQLDGLGNLEVKLSNDFHGLKPLDLSATLTTEKHNWLWAFRNAPIHGPSSSLEWKHEVAERFFFSIRGMAESHGFALSTEMSNQWSGKTKRHGSQGSQGNRPHLGQGPAHSTHTSHAGRKSGGIHTHGGRTQRNTGASRRHNRTDM